MREKWKSSLGCWVAIKCRRSTGRQKSNSLSFPVYLLPFEHFSMSDLDLEGDSEAIRCFDPVSVQLPKRALGRI